MCVVVGGWGGGFHWPVGLPQHVAGTRVCVWGGGGGATMASESSTDIL